MNKLETLINKYPNLKFMFLDDMPTKLSGLCIDDEIHINNNLNTTNAERIVTVSEEITHSEFGTGNIIKQQTITDHKQEAVARKIGCLRLVSVNDLIDCFEKGILEVWEVADELEVTEQCILDALDYIKQTKGLYFFCNDKLVYFTSDSNLKVI